MMLKIALIYTLVNCFILIKSRKEVAVIIGGHNSERASENLEVWTNREGTCVDLDFQQYSPLYNYAGPVSESTGTYLDNHGIFICGGINYDGSFETACNGFEGGLEAALYRLPYADSAVQENGIIKSAMVPWQNQGYLQVGGRYPASLIKYKSSFLYINGDKTLYEDEEKVLKYPRAGHCFVRTRTLSGPSGQNVYIVIGGRTVADMPDDATDILYTLCENDQCDNFEWKTADVKELGDVSDQHSCVSFQEKNNRWVVMLVDNKNTFIIDQSCSQTQCLWTARQPHYTISWEPNSKLTTLDNVPYMFTGQDVFMWITNDDDSIGNGWIPTGTLRYSRNNPTIISVPEDWLCTGYFSTSSTTVTSTSTTTSTSTSTTSTTNTACPSEGQCEAVDGRGVSWTADFWSLAEKDCSEDGSVEGVASWYCDGCSGEFVGEQPDRVECVDKWIDDLEDMIEDEDVSSSEISDIILENLLSSSESGPGITGGGIKTLIENCQSLVDKRQDETSPEDGFEFTDNLLSSTSILVGLEVGWNEIQNDEVRYQSASDMLGFIDEVGYMFGQEKQYDGECYTVDDTFSHDNLEMIVRTNSDDDQCFSFNTNDNTGSICIPRSSISSNEDCPTFVSSHLLLDNTRSNIFPTTIQNTNRNITEPSLSSNLISLTVDNGNIIIDIDDVDGNKINVTFLHSERFVSFVRLRLEKPNDIFLRMPRRPALASGGTRPA